MGSDRELTMEEKLLMIDHEIRTLHQFCINQGYTPAEVEKAARPLLTSGWQERKKILIQIVTKGLFLIGVVVALFYYDPAYRMMCSYGKRASIQLLPLWDWTQLYTDDCLIDNPYYQGNNLIEEDCELCEIVEEIERKSNISQNEVAEDYLKRDTPVIVTDGTRGWAATEKFSIHFLSELYDKEPALQRAKPCYFSCNVRSKVGLVRLLLRGALRGHYDKWYAHWENCDRAAAKFLRQFFHRPYFVPPMVEMAETNWIFVSQNYNAKKYKPADMAHSMGIFAQLRGESRIQLSPRTPCDAVCSKLYAVLREGEVLVFTDFMWILDYLPLGSAQSIAVGIGGFFD